jgi:hypothetical protein
MYEITTMAGLTDENEAPSAQGVLVAEGLRQSLRNPALTYADQRLAVATALESPGGAEYGKFLRDRDAKRAGTIAAVLGIVAGFVAARILRKR